MRICTDFSWIDFLTKSICASNQLFHVEAYRKCADSHVQFKALVNNTLKTLADNEQFVERLLINHNNDNDDCSGKGNSGKANNKQG